MRRPTAVSPLLAALALLAAAAVAGCSSDEAPAPTVPAGSPTYPEPARTVRPFETPLPSATASSGYLRFTVLGIREHMEAFIGTHAEHEAKGELVRIRVAVDNGDASFHPLATGEQLLATEGGRTYPPDYEAMDIARQPQRIDLGRGGRIEFDLWYDVPKGTRLTGVRLRASGQPDKLVPLPAT